MSNLIAVAGTTYVWASHGTTRYPALHIKNHSNAGAAITTWTLGDTVDMWWLNPRSSHMVWQLHADWGKAIYRTAFGMTPSLEISGTNNFYVIPDWRICSNGSVLVSLLHESTNATMITVSSTNFFLGRVVEQLGPPQGVLENPCDGTVTLTLAGDEYVLLYAYTNGTSLSNPNPSKIWIADAPLQIWPNGQSISIEAGFDTEGAILTLEADVERTDGPFVMPYVITNIAGVSSQSTLNVELTMPEAELNDPYYFSSADGANWRIRAALLNGTVTQSEVSLPVRLTWGARPDSLPASLLPGQTHVVTVAWQELPSYLPAEWPTLLNRADLWESAQADTEQYTITLDLMTGTVALVSTSHVMSVGSSNYSFAVIVPSVSATSAWWRARAISGNQMEPASNSHDIVDGFEERPRGEGADKISPWIAFAYSQNNNAPLVAQGVHELAYEGTNCAFLGCWIPSPNAWADVGMYRDFSEPWTLPGPASRSNIIFSVAVRETNGFTGTIEMKVEDGSGGALSYTIPYTGATWSNVSARLTEFSGSINTADVRRLVVLLQAGQRDVTYLACFDAILFTGTVAETAIVVTNGLYESRNDRAPDTDGIPNAWLARHGLPLTLGIGAEDRDADTFNTCEEYAADTDPNDYQPFFRNIWSWHAADEHGVLEAHETTNSRIYFVVAKTNLMDGLPWVPCASNNLVTA